MTEPSRQGPLEQIVRRICDEHGGLRAAARAIGLSAPYLLRLRDGEHPNPSDVTLKKLGIRREVTYVRQ